MKDVVAVFRDASDPGFVHAVQFDPTGNPLEPSDVITTGSYDHLGYDQIGFAVLEEGLDKDALHQVVLTELCTFTVSEPWYLRWRTKRKTIVRLMRSGHFSDLLRALRRQALGVDAATGVLL